MRLKTNKSGESKERRQNYFVDLPPTPLAENHFVKKTLAERGVPKVCQNWGDERTKKVLNLRDAVIYVLAEFVC